MATITESNDPRLIRTDNVLRPMVYTLIDLKTGREVPLLTSPDARTLGYTADSNKAAWSLDGSRVVVTNTFLPISEPAGMQDLLPCGAVVIQIKTLKKDCLYFEDGKRISESPRVQSVAFDPNSDSIRISMRNSNGTDTVRTYVSDQQHWTLTSTLALDSKVPSNTVLSPAMGAKVFIRQDLNDPPVLWAREDPDKSKELWDPNPELGRMRFARASPYEWKDKTGTEWSGILIRPLDYRRGLLYPLVIQLYNYRPHEFMTDGLEPTAFAARELADAGFVVLQVKKQPDTVTELDAQIHLEGYASAIDSLAKDGLVDRTRVGVVGFSLTCWYVVNALIKKPELFRAATIADGLDNSYMQYMLFAAESFTLQRQMDQIRGSAPIGTGLGRWITEAPGFNLDRIRTPVRIEAMGPSSVLQEWELYSSLKMQRKAVDFIYFPKGTHIHELPLERLESQQGDLDWFRFWLMGKKDPDPKKQAEYQRWEELRASGNRDSCKHCPAPITE